MHSPNAPLDSGFAPFGAPRNDGKNLFHPVLRAGAVAFHHGQTSLA